MNLQVLVRVKTATLTRHTQDDGICTFFNSDDLSSWYIILNHTITKSVSRETNIWKPFYIDRSQLSQPPLASMLCFSEYPPHPINYFISKVWRRPSVFSLIKRWKGILDTWNFRGTWYFLVRAKLGTPILQKYCSLSLAWIPCVFWSSILILRNFSV